MIREAEQFAEEDKIAKEKIDAKNSLDSYIYSIKNQIDDEVNLLYNFRKNYQNI
jgi:heat shock protein 5